MNLYFVSSSTSSILTLSGPMLRSNFSTHWYSVSTLWQPEVHTNDIPLTTGRLSEPLDRPSACYCDILSLTQSTSQHWRAQVALGICFFSLNCPFRFWTKLSSSLSLSVFFSSIYRSLTPTLSFAMNCLPRRNLFFIWSWGKMADVIKFKVTLLASLDNGTLGWHLCPFFMPDEWEYVCLRSTPLCSRLGVSSKSLFSSCSKKGWRGRPGHSLSQLVPCQEVDELIMTSMHGHLSDEAFLRSVSDSKMTLMLKYTHTHSKLHARIQVHTNTQTHSTRH